MKACGLFTAAVRKRNPNIEIRLDSVSRERALCRNMSLVRPRAAATFVAPAQFVHQMFQMGRQARPLRAEALLQPFAHSVADRSAGLAIDLFDVVGDSAIHDEFRFPVISFKKVMPDQVAARELVSGRQPIARVFGKIRMKTGAVPRSRNRQKVPVATGPGPFNVSTGDCDQ